MSATPETLTSPSAEDLGRFGYTQQLSRRVGSYASFAAGFSFVSILTTVFQLFGLGFGFGGTAFFWTWPAVLAGQLMVALCFAELAARYPLSGAIYQWARRLGEAQRHHQLPGEDGGPGPEERRTAEAESQSEQLEDGGEDGHEREAGSERRVAADPA